MAAKAETPALPDASSAEASIRAWAAGSPALANLLSAGLSPGQAATRWGLQLLKENQSADAAMVFRAALGLSPGEPDLWTNLGVALDRSGATAEAAASLTRSIGLKNLQPDIWVFLGVLRGKLADPAGAEEAYRTALAQEPNSAAAWQCLGLLKEQERDYPAAIDCLRECVRCGQKSAAISANLGKLYYQAGRVEEAHEAYAAAVRDEPGNGHYERMLRRARFLRDAIEGSAIDDVLARYRVSTNEQASASSSATANSNATANAKADGGAEPDHEVEKELLAWLEVAAGLLSGLGHADAALRLQRKRVELSPESASARYLVDALSGEQSLERAPSDYIVENFDAFAERYDAQLVGVLGYDTPQKLCAAIRERTPANHLYDTLDGGCGTGLCGPLLRPMSRKLTGVDLSSKMLEQAKRRGVYDALVCEELVAFLHGNPAQFDLVVLADVILYFGELGPVFKGAAAALRPGGLFALSTELLVPGSPSPAADPQAQPGYRVLHSGRFAHSTSYVQATAAFAFSPELCAETTLRLEAQGRVRGNLYLFRRMAGGERPPVV